MTIEQIRRLLGKEAENISDEVLLSEFRSAILLKDIFFDLYKKFSSSLPLENSTFEVDKHLT
jgi:hypothetical protein